MIRVLLVDDDPLVRAGLKLIFGGAADLEIVAEVEDGSGVRRAVGSHQPDVVLMDIRMPGMDGIEATRQLVDQPPSIGTTAPAVIVLTTFDADATVLGALRAGASGFLLKHTPPEQLVEAVRRAAAGEPVLSPDVARTLISHATGSSEPEQTTRRRAEARERLTVLTEAERKVADAVCAGWSNAEIAERLYMSVGTVKAHVSSALGKLDLTNRIQLALLVHDATDADDPTAQSGTGEVGKQPSPGPGS